MKTAADDRVLSRLSEIWPARIGKQTESFAGVRQRILQVLEGADISAQGPCHYNMLVENLPDAEDGLRQILDEPPVELYRANVAPFAVQLVRYEYEGLLLEFLCPYGPGFPQSCLERYGPGLHHVGFNAPSLDTAVERLTRLNYSIASGDKVCGPKGDVLFMTSNALLPVHIELCQPKSGPKTTERTKGEERR